jgi:hypothetical protein
VVVVPEELLQIVLAMEAMEALADNHPSQEPLFTMPVVVQD